MATSPPGRSSTLPPLQRTLGPNRARKQSISRRSRDVHHRKQRSRDAKEWTKRGKIDIAGDLLRPTQERPRPYSAEPVARSPWDDLLDAATSVATEDMNEERTPVSLQKAVALLPLQLEICADPPIASCLSRPCPYSELHCRHSLTNNLATRHTRHPLFSRH